eukprot:gene7083-biopygen4119
MWCTNVGDIGKSAEQSPRLYPATATLPQGEKQQCSRAREQYVPLAGKLARVKVEAGVRSDALALCTHVLLAWHWCRRRHRLVTAAHRLACRKRAASCRGHADIIVARVLVARRWRGVAVRVEVEVEEVHRAQVAGTCSDPPSRGKGDP